MKPAPESLTSYERRQTRQALSRASTDPEERISLLEGLEEAQRVETAILYARQKAREIERQLIKGAE